MVKVTRSFPAPASLAIEAKKVNGSYNEPDVVRQLRQDFSDKCYICELKGLSDPEVEHLLPHMNGKYHERKFDWNNLFWACKHCNGVKKAEKYNLGIIDCCKTDPENIIDFTFEQGNVEVEAIDKSDSRSVLTAELIQETFNKTNTGIREAACDVRIKALSESMNVLYKELDRYKKNPYSMRNTNMLKAILRREAAFAAFKRNYVRKRLKEYPGLEAFVC